VRPLPRTVRERVLADLFKELHAEKAFVARLRDPNIAALIVSLGSLYGRRLAAGDRP